MSQKFQVGDMKFCFVRQVISKQPCPMQKKCHDQEIGVLLPYCADFRKCLVFPCFSIYLPDLKLSNGSKCRLFHSVHGSAKFKWLATQGSQVPDYIQ